jgi:stage II sporulation protein M
MMNYLRTHALYIKSLLLYLKVVTAVFIFGIVSGVFIMFEDPEKVIAVIDEYIEELVASVQNASQLDLVLLIAENNITIALLTLVFGFLVGIAPLFVAYINGAFIGMIGTLVAQEGSLLLFIVGVLPHGVIEIPAVIISLALSLRLGVIVIKKILRKPHVAFRKAFVSSFVFFVSVIVPLLVIAACIEVFVTPLLINVAQ